MKLFLSSIRLPNEQELIRLFGKKNGLSVVIVPNAWDTYPKDRQKVELENTVNEFKKLGFKTSALDLVTSPSHLRQHALSTNNFIWIMGGNTFYLNYRVQESGFDKLLKEALNKGLVYGGTSAGAVIATPTIHGAENVDDTKLAPRVIWDGLNLTEIGIVPHWGIEKYAKDLEKMDMELEPYVPQVVKLTNEQAVVVIDDKCEVT